ncbi:MAG: VanZ family protein [Rhodospirillaceae bacterium]
MSCTIGSKPRTAGRRKPKLGARKVTFLRALLVLCASLVLAGTLYPFAIRPGAQLADIVPRLLASLDLPLRKTDAVLNIVLFVPLGGLAGRIMFRQAPPLLRWLGVVVSGLALSAAIEVSQTFIRGRIPSLFDVGFNTLGAAIGAAMVIWRAQGSARLP